eukprot:5755541-Pyramimonas_sp.AAC.1
MLTFDVVGLQGHRIKHGAKLKSAATWARRAGFEFFGGLAQDTGPGPLGSSGGVAVLAAMAAAS